MLKSKCPANRSVGFRRCIITIDNGVGQVAASGSIEVAPSVATTYTLTAISADGVVTTAQVTVTVTGQLCVPTLDGNLAYLLNGGASFATGVYYVNACGGGFQWNKTLWTVAD